MPFLGTIVNFLAVLVCGLVGLLIKKGIPERIANALKCAIGICVIYIGIDSVLEAPPTVQSSFMSDGLIKVLVMLISIALGTLIGELIDIHKWIERLGDFLESKLVKNGEKGKFSEGFIYCSVLFCVGAMTVNGAFADALGNPDILIAKSVMDGISCLIVSTTHGIGCAMSAFFVLIYQGILTLVGLFAADYIPTEIISYMSCTGSLVVILIGTNMLGATKVKTDNMLPSLFLPIIIYPILRLII